MSAEVTLERFEGSLRGAGLRYAKLPLAGGGALLVTGHWGKAFGPFRGGADAGPLWLAPKAATAEGLAAMAGAGDWCIGGDRLWLAPEVRFNIPDRFRWDSGGAYVLPREIDPGAYRLQEGAGGGVRLEQEIELPLYNPAAGPVRLALKREFRAAADPLERYGPYAALRESVHYTGYGEEASIRLLPEGDGGARGEEGGAGSPLPAVEVWNLLQVKPGGVAVVPTTGAVEYQDYYQPADGRHLRVRSRNVLLRLTGDRKYKIGLRSAGLWGRIGWYREVPGEAGRPSAQLLVRQFFNNPSSPYIDEPSGRPGAWGDSVQFYNDDGGLGGFAEIEVHGRSVGGRSGRRASMDGLQLWLYTGGPEEIARVAGWLLGTGDFRF